MYAVIGPPPLVAGAVQVTAPLVLRSVGEAVSDRGTDGGSVETGQVMVRVYCPIEPYSL